MRADEEGNPEQDCIFGVVMTRKIALGVLVFESQPQ